MIQQRNPPTVSQLMAQNRELQDNVNSLTDARDFRDPTASRSGVSYVTSPLSTSPSSRTVPGPRFWIAAWQKTQRTHGRRSRTGVGKGQCQRQRFHAAAGCDATSMKRFDTPSSMRVKCFSWRMFLFVRSLHGTERMRELFHLEI